MINNREALTDDIATALNRHCAENGSNTPDWILAEYLVGCLERFDMASRRRERWYGYGLEIGGPVKLPDDSAPDLTPPTAQPLVAADESVPEGQIQIRANPSGEVLLRVINIAPPTTNRSDKGD